MYVLSCTMLYFLKKCEYLSCMSWICAVGGDFFRRIIFSNVFNNICLARGSHFSRLIPLEFFFADLPFVEIFLFFWGPLVWSPFLFVLHAEWFWAVSALFSAFRSDSSWLDSKIESITLSWNVILLSLTSSSSWSSSISLECSLSLSGSGYFLNFFMVCPVFYLALILDLVIYY